MTAAPYSPAEGVERVLYGAAGALQIGDRCWPLRSLDSVFTKYGLDRGWMAQIAFENGALVLVVANDDVPAVGKLVPYDYPRIFAVSLHHQFDHQADHWYRAPREMELPLAGVRSGRLFEVVDLLDWQHHEDPDPEWSMRSSHSTSRLESSFRRTA